MTDVALYHDDRGLAMAGPTELSLDSLDEANGGVIVAIGAYIAIKYGAAAAAYYAGALVGGTIMAVALTN